MGLFLKLSILDLDYDFSEPLWVRCATTLFDASIEIGAVKRLSFCNIGNKRRKSILSSPTLLNYVRRANPNGNGVTRGTLRVLQTWYLIFFKIEETRMGLHTTVTDTEE